MPAATYTQAPATGELVDLDFFRFNAPAGWPRDESMASDASSGSLLSEDLRERVQVATSGNAGQSDTVDELAESWLTTSGTARGLTKVAPVTIAGQEWFHLTGVVDGLEQADVFGIPYRGQFIVLRFSYDLSLGEPRREETTGSVLASLQLK